MTLNDLKKEYLNSFNNINEFNEVIYHLTEWTTSDMINNNEVNLGEDLVNDFVRIVEKIQRKPLAYVINSRHFYGQDFYVDENVLIPRFESELLVEEALKGNKKYKMIADVCTGSGCLGISVAKENPEAQLFLFDISEEALKIAKWNCAALGVNGLAISGDFLEPLIELKIKPDLILINPPYIDFDDPNVDPLTKTHEPHIALYAPEKGLLFYKRLFKNIGNIYNENDEFTIICEFGWNQKEDISNLFDSFGLKYKIEFKKDYSDNWRYFVIKNGG